MNIKDELKRWNKGNIDGASARFAEKLKLNPGTVSRWINGLSEPKEGQRKRIADELGITVEQLMACFPARRGAGVAAEPSNVGAFQQVSFIEVKGSVSAETFNCIVDSAADDVLPIQQNASKNLVAVRIVGNCMVPTAHDGEYAVIGLQETAESGQLQTRTQGILEKGGPAPGGAAKAERARVIRLFWTASRCRTSC